MGKKCIMCEEDAGFCIKGTSECYCEECAKEHFSDLDLLQRVEEQAQSLKKAVETQDS
ncbi:hypothetical protein HQ529_01340 [Candidatus Woesearchaeota archaeon]|nr:hypothetical protein [Candidatus Woesearchaeota archaeon]